MSKDVSNALRVFLGAGGSGGYLPYGEADRMTSAFADRADDWLREIQKFLALEHPPSDWSNSDLAREQLRFESIAARLFPELDSVAINALACRWSYSWK